MKGFVDNNLVLSDGQAYRTSGLASTNAVRLTVPRLGDGLPIYFHVRVKTTFGGAVAGARQLVVRLQDAADNSGSPDTMESTAICQTTITVTNLVAGLEILRVALPSDTREWVRAYYSGHTMTAGALDAWLSDH